MEHYRNVILPSVSRSFFFAFLIWCFNVVEAEWKRLQALDRLMEGQPGRMAAIVYAGGDFTNYLVPHQDQLSKMQQRKQAGTDSYCCGAA